MARKVSELVVKLTDQVTGPAAKMQAALQRAQSDLGKVKGYKDQKAALDAMVASHAKAREHVRQLAVGMNAATNPTRKMQAAYEKATQSLDKLGNKMDWQKAKVRGAADALGQMGVRVNALAAGENRLRAATERATAAIVAQETRAARSARRRQALGTLGAGAGVYAGHALRRATKSTLHTYREFDKERRFGKAVMEINDEDQKPLVAQAIHMGATTKYNDVQVLEAQRELAARGLKKDQVMGMMKSAADLGQSLDLALPDAVKQMEGAIFGFKKNISTLDDALKSAKHTADLQVRASKLSGMTPEDITQLYKYGATPARMGGVSEEMLLAFGGISKKANMGGDESGVAWRALIAAATSPTRKGKEALLANGLNFKNYQKNRDSIDLDPFVQNVAAQYGVKLGKAPQAALAKIFANKDLISDPAKFAPAVMQALGATLGGGDAKSKKSIAGAANRYRDASVVDIDRNAFIKDLMQKLPGNLNLANAIFGSKQGARIATALGEPETMKKFVDSLGDATGYAEKISKERMAGFDGAASRLAGATKNLETAIGRAMDNDGKGGVLTSLTDATAKAVQGLAELSETSVQVGTALAVIGGGGAAIGGTFKLINDLLGGNGPAIALTTSAGLLGKSALALDAAAVKLAMSGGGGGLPTVATAAGAGATGQTIAQRVGGKIKRFARSPIGRATGIIGGGLIGKEIIDGTVDVINDMRTGTAKHGLHSSPQSSLEGKLKLADYRAEIEEIEATLGRLREKSRDPDTFAIANQAAISRLAELKIAYDNLKAEVTPTRAGTTPTSLSTSGTPVMAPFPPIRPPDLGGLEAAKDKAAEVKAGLDSLNMTATPTVNLASVQELERTLLRIDGLMSRIGGQVGGVKSAMASASSPPTSRGRSEAAVATANLSRSRETNNTGRPSYG